jgi:hypothetical protein
VVKVVEEVKVLAEALCVTVLPNLVTFVPSISHEVR